MCYLGFNICSVDFFSKELNYLEYVTINRGFNPFVTDKAENIFHMTSANLPLYEKRSS